MTDPEDARDSGGENGPMSRRKFIKNALVATGAVVAGTAGINLLAGEVGGREDLGSGNFERALDNFVESRTRGARDARNALAGIADIIESGGLPPNISRVHISVGPRKDRNDQTFYNYFYADTKDDEKNFTAREVRAHSLIPGQTSFGAQVFYHDQPFLEDGFNGNTIRHIKEIALVPTSSNSNELNIRIKEAFYIWPGEVSLNETKVGSVVTFEFKRDSDHPNLDYKEKYEVRRVNGDETTTDTDAKETYERLKSEFR